MPAMPVRACDRALQDRQELRALFHSRHLIHKPTPRLLALGGLYLAARRSQMPAAPIVQSLREALAQIISGRPMLREAPSTLSHLLDAPSPDLPARLARMVSPTPLVVPGGIVPTLLELGLVDRARASAAALPQSTRYQRTLRTRMIRLAASGVLNTGPRRRFVPAPHTAGCFPPSLPSVTRCTAALAAGRGDASLEALAWSVTRALSVADQQAARVQWALVAWRQGGELDAATMMQSIRYRSRRAEAGLLLIQAALHEGHRDAARRFADLLPTEGRSRASAAEMLAAEQPPVLAEAHPGLSAAYVLQCLRGGSGGPKQRARAWSSKSLQHPEVSALVLQAMETEGRDLERELPRLRRQLGPEATDHLWSAHILQRCARLGAVPSPGPAVSRAAADEAALLTEDGWPRRKMVARVCRIALLRAAQAPAAEDWAVRLRTLGHIGGSLGTGVLTELLDRAPQEPGTLGPAIRAAAAGLLAEVDPDACLRWLVASGDTLPSEVLGTLLSALARRRRQPAAAAEQWATLRRIAARSRGPEAVEEFCTALLRTWRRYGEGLPTPTVLAGATQELLDHPQAEPATLFTRAVREIAETLGSPQRVLASTLARDALRRKRLQWIAPARLPAKAVPWSDAQLRTVLQRLVGSGETVDVRPLERVLLHLPAWKREPLRTHLLHGSPLVSGGPAWSLDSRRRLRHLDKRRDLLTFLRLADAVPCCWATSSRYSGQTHGRLLSLWRDPLSFAFHIEAEHAGGWSPIGFVFGALALVEDGCGQTEAAMVLNGIYLRRQRFALRDRVLARIEEQARALGIAHIGVATRYNGSGGMPGRYRLTDRRVHRLRALTVRGVPVQFAIDDIGMGVNTITRLRHLHWARVQA